MAAIIFPENPTINQIYLAGDYAFQWNGSAWIGISVSPEGLEGPQGATGPKGDQGNSVTGSTGATGEGTTGATGANAIGQVQSTTKTDTYYAQNVSSWTDLPGISVTITPTSTSSKIWVILNLRMGTGPNEVVHLRLLRNSTPIGNGIPAGNRPGAFTSYSNVDNAFTQYNDLGNNYLDSPNTTSPVTYKVQAINESFGVDQVSLNRVPNDNNNVQVARTSSTITAVEVL